MRLRYETVAFEETRNGSHVEARTSRESVQIAALERTGRGFLRVVFSVDNEAIAEMFVDGAGTVADVAMLAAKPSNPLEADLAAEMTKGLLRLFQNPLGEFRKDQWAFRTPYTFEMPMLQALGFGLLGPSVTAMFKPSSGQDPRATVTWVYTGLKLLEGAQVIEFRSQVIMPRVSYRVKSPDEPDDATFSVARRGH